MEDGRSVKISFVLLLLLRVRLSFVDVGLSVAGCIEIKDRARHLIQLLVIESLLLINRNSYHISDLVAVVAKRAVTKHDQEAHRSNRFQLRRPTIIIQQQQRTHHVMR